MLSYPTPSSSISTHLFRPLISLRNLPQLFMEMPYIMFPHLLPFTSLWCRDSLNPSFLSPRVCARTPSHWVVSELSDPLDCSPPASSVSGISRVRTLQGVAMPFSRGFPALTGWFFTNESPAETLPSHTLHSFSPSSIQQIYLSCEVQPVHGVQEPKQAPK